MAGERPRKALEILKGIGVQQLTLDERSRLRRIEDRARRQIDDGVIELGE